MARALVTGANGHIGANLVRLLLEAGYEVVPFVRESSDLRGLEGLDLDYFYGDVLEARSLEEAAEGCQLVFHLAAVYKTRAKDVAEVMRPAVDGTRNALAAAAKAGVERFVHTSSVAAVGYSRHPDEPRDESNWYDEKALPYNDAKVESERQAYRLADEHGVDMVVVCPGWVLGPYDYRVTPSSRYVQQLLNGKGMTGKGGFSLINVKDVARGHLLAAEKGTKGERYILTGESLLGRELGEMIGDICGKRPPHIALPRWLSLFSVSLMEWGARLIGREPAVTRAEAVLGVDRYQVYDTSKAFEELGLRADAARAVLEEAASWLAFLGALKEPVAKRILERYPADPSWPAP